MPKIPERARPHHWGFANAWLRSSFERKPETIVTAIARAPGAEPVLEAWHNFAKTLEEEDRLDPDGLATESYRIPVDDSGAEWFLAVVEMPRPQGLEEAWYVALAVRPADGALRAEREDESPRPETEIRYFVLEQNEGEKRRLVEWIGDEREQHDIEPAAESTAFVRAIRNRLGTATDRS